MDSLPYLIVIGQHFRSAPAWRIPIIEIRRRWPRIHHSVDPELQISTSNQAFRKGSTHEVPPPRTSPTHVDADWPLSLSEGGLWKNLLNLLG